MKQLVCNPGKIFWCWSGGCWRYLFILAAKFNSNFDNTPNQGVREYTAHNTTITREKNIGDIIISWQSSDSLRSYLGVKLVSGKLSLSWIDVMRCCTFNIVVGHETFQKSFNNVHSAFLWGWLFWLFAASGIVRLDEGPWHSFSLITTSP